MAFHIWRLQDDEMTIMHSNWADATEVASTLTEQTGVYHVAVEQGSEYEQHLLAEKEHKEHPSPVTIQPDSILSLIQGLEEQWRQGKISFEECSHQQQRWYRMLACVDGR